MKTVSVRKVSTILFWMLMVTAAASLWLTVRGNPRGALRTAAFIVPFVLLSSWVQSRFKGPRRWPATIVIYSALLAMGAGSIVVWDLELFRRGFGVQSMLVEGVVAGAIFLVSVGAFAWSLLRLLRRSDKLPA
jgi:hypothetical protein